MKEYKEYGYLTKAIPLPDGKRKYIRGKTKKELDRKVLEFQIAMAQGRVVVSSSMTVRELATTWLEQVKKPEVRSNTYTSYCCVVDLHILPVIGDMLVSDVKQVHILNVMHTCGYEAKAPNRKLITILRAIFRFAVDNDIISKTPVPDRMSVIGNAAPPETPLTPNQTKLLLEHCKSNKDPNVYLFTLLALTTGMRRGEIAALRWDCVDFQTGEIKVRRQLISNTSEVTDELKTEAARRDIPVPGTVLSLLKQVRSTSSSTYVLPGTKDGHILTLDISRYERVWNRSGLSPNTIHAHLFRKTYATRLIETGTDPKRVQYLLGHSTLEMTLGTYALYDRESQRAATKELVSTAFSGLVSAM